MDQQSVPTQANEATPIFGAYRRGYDPEQVDRYVADQQRRVDEAALRASEAERKLAAAVGQLRELHRRVAVLESEDRSPQPTPLDTLGERVQRILQEAWEGAYALRQSTEQEMSELRERTAGEAEAIVVAARQRARAIEAEIERRRNAYLERVEEDRTRALTQIAHLHHQRDAALGELLKVKDVIEATVNEMSSRRPAVEEAPEEAPEAEVAELPLPQPAAAPRAPSRAGERAPARPVERVVRARVDDELARTMPVERLDLTTHASPSPSPSELVRSHRSVAAADGDPRPGRAPQAVRPAGSVFDFDAER